MKMLYMLLFAGLLTLPVKAQSIIGKWQLTKETTCVENDLETDAETQELVDEMKSRGTATARIVTFKDNKSGEETTKILMRRKGANTKNFLYKFDGTNLYILDKKSQTITETYTVDRLEGDSMILSNAARACDTKVFVRLK